MHCYFLHTQKIINQWNAKQARKVPEKDDSDDSAEDEPGIEINRDE